MCSVCQAASDAVGPNRVVAMRVRLGFFESFKSADTLLMAGDAAGLDGLARELQRLADGGAASIAVHALPFVAGHHGVRLFADRGPCDLGVSQQAPMCFRWALSFAAWTDLVPLFEPLVQDQASGHQYLDERATVRVMVSRGEYGDDWWAVHG